MQTESIDNIQINQKSMHVDNKKQDLKNKSSLSGIIPASVSSTTHDLDKAIKEILEEEGL